MAHTNDKPGSEHPSEPTIDLLQRMGYESRDVSVAPVAKMIIFLFFFIALSSAAAMGVYKLFVPTYAEVERISPLTRQRALPAAPQLQALPKRDMILYRRAEDTQINGYTKGDRGTVNLPLATAIDLLAQKGISGQRGLDMPRPIGDAYPGSGKYTTDPLPSQNLYSGNGDTMNYGGNNALQEGNPNLGSAGGTKAAPPKTEAVTPPSARTENSSRAAKPAAGGSDGLPVKPSASENR